MATYLLLLGAIVAEVVATSALSRSDGFTKAGPSAVAVVGYALALWLLSICLRTIPTGIAYAIWSGVGIVLIALVAWLWQGQKLDGPAIAGLGLIITGVLVVQIFSKSVTH
ncbi:SMR family transporter [Ancylobacter sp. 6x-1]|uniref:SMR family transporter n=1 Tax=Ancylobacter crimeensis TaxID=2579147 RepID=A0ABT0DAS4_9HYPH|nr:SMR family transporter [Ancylobacter crimeensis]MCK0197048.1 SMR family transporter [Ancylobacter crimeensis]